MSMHPLARAPLSAVFARAGGCEITVAAFLRDVAGLAELLPHHARVANLCHDRYRFAVGFAAALVRGQVTVLPPSETPAVLADILHGQDVYCLVDHDIAVPAPVFVYPQALHGDRDDMPAFPAMRIAAILYTSGSTGMPQPHPRSWGKLVESALSAGREIGADRLCGAALIGTVPHQHSYGLESLVMLALQHGLVLHAERPFYPADILDCLARAPRPRILVTTPAHLRVLLAEADLPAVDLVLSATAPLSPEMACAAEEAFVAPLHEIYGCSEVGQLAQRRTVHTEEWRCLDGVSLAQQNGSGFAVVAGVLTRLADILELRDTRHFRLLGRDADLVNIAGKRSSLAYLAARLCAVGGVQDAVFAMAEAGSGPARLVAMAVAPGCDAGLILAGLRARIDPAFMPRRLLLVETLPRNALGKITRAELQALLATAE